MFILEHASHFALRHQRYAQDKAAPKEMGLSKQPQSCLWPPRCRIQSTRPHVVVILGSDMVPQAGYLCLCWKDANCTELCDKAES